MKYMIAHNESDIVHFAQLNSKQKFDSGQPNKEEFTDFDSFIARLDELGVDTSDIKQQQEYGPTTSEKIEQVRQEAKQRTEQVVDSIADIVESHDFKKDNTGQDLAQKIRESKNKNL